MKPINNLMTMAIVLLAMVVSGACSTDNAPNDDGQYDRNKEIDTKFLSMLARGEASIALELDEWELLEKVYDPASGIDGEWHESLVEGWETPNYSSLQIIDGLAWRAMPLSDMTGSSILYYPWKYYREETDFDKNIKIAESFEYDADNNKLVIDKCEYDIEKADSKKLVLSETFKANVPDEKTHKKVPGLIKSVLSLIRSKKSIDDNYMYFKSEKEAKLAMTGMMREYFGDIIDLREYADEEDFDNIVFTNPIIDLAAVEADIANDRDEWTSWFK